jgi:hypothetical protein
MTSVSDQPRVDAVDVDRLRRRSRVLTAAVVVLAVVVISLGVWVVYDTTAAQGTAAPADIEQLIGGYFAAANENDADAADALVTDEFVVYEMIMPMWREADGSFDTGSLAQARWKELSRQEFLNGFNLAPLVDAHVERVGDPVVVGEGPWLAAQAYRWQTPGDISNPEGYHGISVYTIVAEDGTLRIARAVAPAMHAE